MAGNAKCVRESCGICSIGRANLRPRVRTVVRVLRRECEKIIAVFNWFRSVMFGCKLRVINNVILMISANTKSLLNR